MLAEIHTESFEARIRFEYGLPVIGLRHGNKAVMHALLEETFKIGDILQLTGFLSHIDDVVVLNMPVELEKVPPAARRAPHALATLGPVVVLMVSGLVPNVQAALIGCMLTGAFGLRRLAYRLSTARALVLVVGMLPCSLALQRTGGVDLAANAVVGFVGTAPRHVLADVARHHRCARLVHRQYGNGRTDGAGGAGDRQRPWSLALSVRDDRRAGCIRGFHDLYLIASKHAGR